MTEHLPQNVYRHRTSITLTVMITSMTSKSYVYWGAACRQTLVCWCGRVRKPCRIPVSLPSFLHWNLVSTSVVNLSTVLKLKGHHLSFHMRLVQRWSYVLISHLD